MPFFLDPVAGRRTRQIHDPRETEDLVHGDLVDVWSYVFLWDEFCLPEATLARCAPLRSAIIGALTK